MQPFTFCSSAWLVVSVAISVADPIMKLHFLRFLNASSAKYFSPGEILVISIPENSLQDADYMGEESWKSRLDSWNITNASYLDWETLRVSGSNSYSYKHANILGTSSYKQQDMLNFNSMIQNSCTITNQSHILWYFNNRRQKTWKYMDNNPYYKCINQGISYTRRNTTTEDLIDAHMNTVLSKYHDFCISNQNENIWDFQYHMIRMLHEALKWPLIISSVGGSGYQATKYKDSNYIITTRACNMSEQVLQHTERQLQALRTRASWNPRGRFLVLVTNDYGAFRKILAKRMLELLWSFKVLNAVVVIPQRKSALIVYTWFPYQSPEICTQVREVVLNYWLFENNGRFLFNTSLFPQKIPQDFKGCSISVSTLEIEPFVILSYRKSEVFPEDGVEGRLFRSVMKKLNLQYKLELPGNESWGEKLPNNTWTGMKGDLISNVTELGFGGLLLDRELCELFECTITYLKDRLVWYVPRARQVAQWKGFYRVFEKETWMVILTVNIMVALLLWRMGRIYKETSYSSLAKSLSHVWAMILGISVPEQPRASRPRLLFLFWIIYCLHMNAVYLSFLNSFLIKPGFERQIRTVEELVRSNLDYGFHSVFDKYFIDSTDKILVKILSRRKHCEGDGEECLRRMADRGDFAMLVSSLLIQYKSALDFVDDSGNSLFNHFEDSFHDNEIVMYLTKGSLLLERLDNILHRTVESGLVEHWWEEMKNTLRLKQALLTVEKSSTLSFSHLQPVFMFHFFGLAISFTVFIGEFLYFRLRMTK